MVQTFVSLMESQGRKIVVNNKKRFKEEFGEAVEEQPARLQRPDDYRAVFSGNVDDHFRIGGRAEPRSDWLGASQSDQHCAPAPQASPS